MTSFEPNRTVDEQARPDGHVLRAVDLTKDFTSTNQSVHALRGISLSVRAREMVVIMGASGSGKSTLLHLLGGLDQPSQGGIVIEGNDLVAMSDRQRTLFRRRRLGIVFQAYNLLPTLTAVENVALPAMLEGAEQRTCEQKAISLLQRVDLGHRLKHRPQALSGGEQQRVAIARALMNDPALIFADEPTGNLDSEHGTAIWTLLASLVRDSGRTVVAVTHEPDRAAFADRVIVLKDGQIVGEMDPGGEDHAAAVATRYRELVG